MEGTPRLQPKAELHLHLDCCVSYACVAKLCPGTTLAEYLRDYVAPAKCADLVDFLKRPTRVVRLMQTPSALRLVTDDLFAQLAADNVAYAEVRFAPLLHTADGMRPEQVVEVVEAAVAEASAATGVRASVILCTLRHFDADASMATARLAAARVGGGVVTGFDIAGDEAGFGLDAHVAAFDFAREHGVRITAHAGEARGADGVNEILDRLRPERIGHGVRSIEDERTLERLVAEGVHLEVCPTSNVQTMGSLVASYADHPVDRLRRAGVSLSISTDARTVANVTLDREYERLRHFFGWSTADLARCNLAAVEAGFADAAVRRELMPLFAAAVGTEPAQGCSS
ncbi:adenosine deaminase [Actinomadura miaoliensis]|uniref:adenosine deaminase n=1 Tax=Actinomadura miaoliensis TaxID=430685 RepID=A0ABP7W0F0_9ACTN